MIDLGDYLSSELKAWQAHRECVLHADTPSAATLLYNARPLALFGPGPVAECFGVEMALEHARRRAPVMLLSSQHDETIVDAIAATVARCQPGRRVVVHRGNDRSSAAVDFSGVLESQESLYVSLPTMGKSTIALELGHSLLQQLTAALRDIVGPKGARGALHPLVFVSEACLFEVHYLQALANVAEGVGVKLVYSLTHNSLGADWLRPWKQLAAGHELVRLGGATWA